MKLLSSSASVTRKSCGKFLALIFAILLSPAAISAQEVEVEITATGKQSPEAEKYYQLANQAPKDSQEQFDLYLYASVLGHGEAMKYVGVFYASGKGPIEQDYDEALKWYKLSYDAGYKDAARDIGHWYANYSNPHKNYTEAIKWYKIYYNAPHSQGGLGVTAQNIALCYEKLNLKDDANIWYMTAADHFLKNLDQGNIISMIDLALLYQYNLNDKEQAIYWYKKHADYHYENGGTEERYTLGKLRELGVYYHPSEHVKRDSDDSSSSSTSAKWTSFKFKHQKHYKVLSFVHYLDDSSDETFSMPAGPNDYLTFCELTPQDGYFFLVYEAAENKKVNYVYLQDVYIGSNGIKVKTLNEEAEATIYKTNKRIFGPGEGDINGGCYVMRETNGVGNLLVLFYYLKDNKPQRIGLILSDKEYDNIISFPLE